MTAHRDGPATESTQSVQSVPSIEPAEPGQPAAAAGGFATPVPAWRDPARPAGERAADLLSRMTPEEKLAQLSAIWLSGPADGNGVAPFQGEFTGDMPPLPELIRDGLGQLTRVFGTRPVHPAEGMRQLARLQAQVTEASRFAIPAIVHEECLTGFAAWTATAFPTPLAWGASFDPGLVFEVASAIGDSMRAAGVHQGLAPVLDVARDSRWGRVEETIGEDPYLVAVVGTAYVRGLQSAGVIATLKHFAGYSASRAGRNLAPVSMGRREYADVILPPFEMAIREGGARSVMHSYADVDGVPAAADRELLTVTLREEFGFDGVVVADYYGISFLETLHRVAGSPAEAAALALRAGVDVELPNVRCYGAPLAAAVRAGQVSERLVDQAAGRVLRQKIELGLLDSAARDRAAADGAGERASVTGLPHAGGTGERPNGTPQAAGIDLNPPAHRVLARRLAEESIVLLANDGGLLPLREGPLRAARLAVVGPLADDPLAFFGCYTFPRHVGHEHPGKGIGVTVTTLLAALRQELPQARFSHARGCSVTSQDREGFGAALECAHTADAVIAVLGDEAGLFGRGSSGEGCDAADLRLPGPQADLLAELVATGKPVILVVVSGRPYALGPAAGQLAAVVQAFFPGQEGGTALARVLSGAVVPSGKLPIEVPASPGGQPSPYLRPPLAAHTSVSSVDPTPRFPFGHGLSYTTFGYFGLTVRPAPVDGVPDGAPTGAGPARIATDGTAEISLTVRNTGDRAGTEVVQLYLSDPVAEVARPVRWLAGFARVELRPGQTRRVSFRLHADRTAYHGLAGIRVVDPGLIEVAAGSSSADLRLRGCLELCGPQREAGADRVLTTPATVTDA
jgi:beta-xylosidase